MTFLLTNDDGIDAPGINALLEVVRPRTAVIVAPDTEQSGCGHRVTTRRALTVLTRSASAHSVDGTPADCVRLALNHLTPRVSWVLAGINDGSNLGVDIHISGTVAAVREATFHGIPAIAFSHYRRGGNPVNWQQAQPWAAKVLDLLLQQPPEPHCFWNVNLPCLSPQDPEPTVQFCPLSHDPLPIDYLQDGDRYTYNSNYRRRRRTSGTDVSVCLGGAIAVTKIHV